MEKLIEEYGEQVISFIVAGLVLGIACSVFFFSSIPQLLMSYVTEIYG